MSAAQVALIALHGDGGGAFHFSRLPPLLPPEVSFHAPTLPGFGGLLRDPRVASLRDFADLLAGFLIDLDPPRVLLGHGLGAAITFELLTLHPQLVTGAILHDPPGRNGDSVLPWRTRLARRWLLASPHFARERRARRLVGKALAGEVGEECLDSVLRSDLLLETPAWLAAARPAWRPLTAPTLLLAGKAPLDPQWRRLLPAAELLQKSSWGPYPMMEEPGEYAKILADSALRFAASW